MADTTFFGRLKKLFTQTAIVTIDKDGNRKVADTEHRQQTNLSSLRDRYTKIQRSYYEQAGGSLSMAYQQVRREVFRDFDAMDNDPIIACLSGDTKISTLNGFIPIEELTKLYGNGELFEVWSWDKDTCKYTIGNAHHPRKTGVKHVIELHLDNSKMLKCTKDHRIMLIDGTYKEAGLLKPGDSIMPFYYSIKEYMKISNRAGKFKKVHRYIYEDIYNKDISGKHIHHINHNKYDNRTANLVEMTPANHMEYHKLSPITANKKKLGWTTEMREKQSERVKNRWKSSESRDAMLTGIKNYQNRHDFKELASAATKEKWKLYDDSKRAEVLSGFTKWQNSTEGKEFMSVHSSKLNKKRWKEDTAYAKKMASIFSNHAKKLWADPEWAAWKRKTHSEIMRLKYANDPTLRDRTKRIGEQNGRFKSEITNEFILNNAIKFDTLTEFTDTLSLDCKNKQQFIARRLKSLGYESFTNFKENYIYQNHKLVKIVDNNEKIDVYDLTVDTFENFALKCGIIVSNSALDIFSDESTLKNEFGDILTINSNNQKVQDLLTNLFYDVLNIEFNLWPWVRNLCKYGDFFLGLEIAEGKGIVNATPHSVYNTERLERTNPDNPNEVKFKIEEDPDNKQNYDDFEIAHFRLLSDTNWLPYGKSMIENGRRLWKQLSLMEDAMLIHRIMRAPEKRIFKIDIGNIKPTEVDNYMQVVINKMKKVPFLDKNSGDYNLKYNMQNLTEDFYLPVRGSDSGTNIENISGLEYTAIEDIDYLKSKLFAALKIPKAYLGYDENVNGKATLAAEDVRFARTIERIQRTVVSELAKIAIIHLYANGITDSEMTNFDLSLVNPSTIYEQEKVNLWSEKVSLASDMINLNMVSKNWIYENIFNFAKGDEDKQRIAIINDLKDKFRYNSIENDGNDPAKPPKQTDVDESLEKLKVELKNKGGRPSEGNTYGKDKHPYGRDPLGNNERLSALKHRTTESQARKYISGIKSKRKIINEDGSMLDENNILEDC